MATHSGIPACRIPWTEETGGLQSTRSQESDTTEQLHTRTHLASKDKIILISGPADDLP